MLRESVVRVVLAAMASMIATGAAAWLAFGQGTVSRVEMEEYVDKAVGAVTREVARTTGEIARLRDLQLEQIRATERLTSRVDMLLGLEERQESK